MENGLVNLINHMPTERYRHMVICMTDHDDFASRIAREDVPIVDLHKPPGKGLGVHSKLFRTYRNARPHVVHTRNLSTMEAQLPALLSGVRCRVHGEHGREIEDVTGTSRRSVWLRRMMAPCVQTFVPMSKDLECWLKERIGIPGRRITQIYNGVRTDWFHPHPGGRAMLPRPGFSSEETVVIGSVGRMDNVKDQLTLVRAFLRLLELLPAGRQSLRLVHIGDGALMPAAKALLHEAGVADLAWFPGGRDDVPCLLRGFDIFVLPSLGEGISNTILEAMATALPVVATQVGGNPELVDPEVTGKLVPPADPEAMAAALRVYIESRDLRRRHGLAGRRRVETCFSIERMVHQYMDLYDSTLARQGISGVDAAGSRESSRPAS